ncbi:hypothetical protein FHY08_002116 [Pseudomonas koreensis]|nr:hypothetical protein [Pseudomonas koreensis]
MKAMTAVKAFCAASILTLSSLAMAEGGGDRVYGRMMQENQQAMGNMPQGTARLLLKLFIMNMV